MKNLYHASMNPLQETAQLLIPLFLSQVHLKILVHRKQILDSLMTQNKLHRPKQIYLCFVWFPDQIWFRSPYKIQH